MMKKITIILISFLTAFIIMSSGYGLWQKTVTIEGDIEVVPDPEVIKSLQATIEYKYQEIDLLLEDQRILEEQRLLEEQKKQEEQRLLEEQKKKEEENRQVQIIVDIPSDEDINEDTDNKENNDESEIEIIIIDENYENSTSDVEDATNTTIQDEVDQVEDFNNQ